MYKLTCKILVKEAMFRIKLHVHVTYIYIVTEKIIGMHK